MIPKEVLKVAGEPMLKGVNYASYRAKITELLATGRVTGNEQKDVYLQYTTLNEHRMNRWDKHFVPDDQMMMAMKSIKSPRTWVIISEGWCGDSAQNLPAIEKIALLNPLVTTQYLFRDENDAIMQEFLTDGNRSIPVVACLNQHGQLLWKWGPYPTGARELINHAKASGVDKSKWKEDLHLWYARNKQLDLQQDLIRLIQSEND